MSAALAKSNWNAGLRVTGAQIMLGERKKNYGEEEIAHLSNKKHSEKKKINQCNNTAPRTSLLVITWYKKTFFPVKF